MAAESGQLRDHDGDPGTAAEGADVVLPSTTSTTGVAVGLGRDAGSISVSAARFGQGADV